MSEQIKINLTRLGVIVALIAGIATLAKAFWVSPDRIDQIEKRVVTIEERMATSSELLIRIDENVKALKEAHK